MLMSNPTTKENQTTPENLLHDEELYKHLDEGEHDQLVRTLLKPFMTLARSMYSMKGKADYAVIQRSHVFPDLLIKGHSTKGAELAIEVKTTRWTFEKSQSELATIIEGMKFNSSISSKIVEARTYYNKLYSSGEDVPQSYSFFLKNCIEELCGGYTPRVLFKSYLVKGQPSKREIRMFYKESFNSQLDDFEPILIEQFEDFCDELHNTFKCSTHEFTITKMYKAMVDAWNNHTINKSQPNTSNQKPQKNQKTQNRL